MNDLRRASWHGAEPERLKRSGRYPHQDEAPPFGLLKKRHGRFAGVQAQVGEAVTWMSMYGFRGKPVSRRWSLVVRHVEQAVVGEAADDPPHVAQETVARVAVEMNRSRVCREASASASTPRTSSSM
jgi:hypothetical protein